MSAGAGRVPILSWWLSLPGVSPESNKAVQLRPDAGQCPPGGKWGPGQLLPAPSVDIGGAEGALTRPRPRGWWDQPLGIRLPGRGQTQRGGRVPVMPSAPGLGRSRSLLLCPDTCFSLSASARSALTSLSLGLPTLSHPGFDLMAAFGLVEKEYASVRGVAMEPSAFGSTRTFTLFRDAQLTRRARWARRAGCDPGGGGASA